MKIAVTMTDDVKALKLELERLRGENEKCVYVVGEYGRQVGALKALLCEARDYLKYPAPHKNPTELEDRIAAVLSEK